MADREVDIRFKTTGASKTAADAKRVGKATTEAGKAAEAAARKALRLSRAGNESAKGTRNAGMAALEASRAFEDAQYGMRGVLNNIPGLVMMLGGSAGLAGAVSIAAVGASILAKNLEKLQEEAKDATAAGAEMTDELREFLGEANVDELNEFVAELDRMEQAQRLVSDASADAAAVEAERRQSLDRIGAKLREAAELEIRLAKARGEISAQDAEEQLSSLRIEAELSVGRAKLALMDDRVDAANREFTNKLTEIRQLEERSAEIEKRLEERQAGVAPLARWPVRCAVSAGGRKPPGERTSSAATTPPPPPSSRSSRPRLPRWSPR